MVSPTMSMSSSETPDDNLAEASNSETPDDNLAEASNNETPDDNLAEASNIFIVTPLGQ